jgi:hypothetical protein
MKKQKTITHQVDAVVSKFHSHLDICLQCRENPFNLCPVGAKLLTDCVNKPMPKEFGDFINDNFWELI